MAIEKLKFLVTADTKNFALGMKAVGALAVAAFAAAIKVSAEFEKQLSKLRAVSGANVIQMGELETQARKLGKSTAFTAVEVAGLQVELAKLGFTSKQILQSSGGILDLAAGLGVELSDAAKLTGTSIRAFGLEAEDTGRVVDVLAKAAASSALDFTTLTEGLKDAAPIAKLYNFTIEDTVALLAQLSNAGIKGSKAGIALRQIFLELDKKGIAFADALNQVNNSANPAATAMDLVGKRAAGAFAIIAQNQGAVNGLATELRNAEGAANEMRLIMEDNLIGDFDKLKSAVTEMGLSIGEVTDGPLRSFVQWMTEVINGSDTTLSFIDSLARVFLFLEESALLAFKAVEELWIVLQMIATSNPLTGKQGIASPDSLKRLAELKNRLAEINGEIIKISNYGGSSSNTGGGTKGPAAKTSNTIGAGGSGDGGGLGGATNFGFGFASFFEPSAIEGASTQIDGLLDRVESKFTSVTGSVKSAGADISSSFDGIAFAAGAASSLVGQLGASLLGTDSSALERAGVAIVSTLASIAIAAAVASAGESAAATGPAAIFTLPVFIGIGLAAVAAALAGTGGSVSSSGGGSRSPVTPTTTTPSSVQGNGAGGSLVATVRGQDLRFILQAADNSYGALS